MAFLLALSAFSNPEKLYYYLGEDNDKSLWTPLVATAKKFRSREDVERFAVEIAAGEPLLMGHLSVAENVIAGE